ncbi:CinA family nicotinamide mononucleotide deamidase-related protein [Deinococcus peraridilitoris]|uniref:CinA family nicotinamide mononucleotide deamidase-related protein n=1 Tax=Deinococcus peraridilitoris TaxID=432329 RepID=UPI0012F8A2CF|nr:CinA family nicotinamide mononucleotide deamidase-related protein [Deinococcus peraridilitoris]
MSVGTELLLGEITDTNAAFLASELKSRGVTLYHKNVVGDNLGRIVDTLRLALSRADLVIVGGGLGPTDDDLTREAIAEVAGETPTIDDEQLRHVRGLFENRGRSFPDANRKQAWLIPSAQVLPNPVGTAPGWFVRQGGKIIVALPGPPREMQPMWREQVVPRLEWPARALWSTTLHTWGLGESHIAELLGQLTTLANPSVATYARRHGVDVRVAASAQTLAIAEQLAAPTLEQVQSALSESIYGRDGEMLAANVARRLKARGESVASTELGSAALTHQLALQGFSGGTVVGSETSGPFDEQTALQLARQARTQFHADWGVASMVGDSSVVALSGPLGERSLCLDWPAERSLVAERAASSVLMLMLQQLREVERQPEKVNA